ncbi:hypothetical protein MMC20_004018 [Loxospora ochrophaea]|nr:hypothetical protein [Loxospora ochrophaea]
MSCVVGLYRDVATEHVVNDGGEIKTLKPGDRIFIDCITASKDPTGFPNPNEVVLDRPMDSYIHYGWGPHICLGYGLSKTAMMTMLKTIGRLDNLRRTPGPQGQIKKINGPEGVTLYMTPDHSSFFPFPTTMKIQWDGDLPALPVGRPRRVWGLDV